MINKGRKKDIEQEPEVTAECPGEAVEESCDAQAEPVAEENLLEAELAKQKESYLRLAAEYDNFRKRTQREKDALSAEIKCGTIAALLPVIDNIERALAAENASAEDIRKGVEMVLTQTTQIFENLGASSFGEAGDAFDPNIHHCIGMVADENYESGEVVLVVQKGYKAGDRVIRPAMVQVAE